MDYLAEIDKRILALQTELTRLTIARDVLVSVREDNPPVKLVTHDKLKTKRAPRDTSINRRQVVLEALAYYHDPVHASVLAKRLDWNYKTTTNVLYGLKTLGKIEFVNALAYLPRPTQETES